MKRIYTTLWVIILILTSSGCTANETESKDTLFKLSYASVPAIVEAPAHVAYQKDIFAEKGLDVTLEINPDGKTSLEHLFDGSVDIAAVMGTPVVYSSFERDDFTIIATMEHDKIHYALARKDHGIEKASDLVGKRAAVMQGTSGHFFMDSYLAMNKLSRSDLDIVEMNAPEAVEAIVNNEIDAMFYWSPFPLIAKTALGDKGIILECDNIVPASWVIVTKRSFAAQHSDVLKSFLRAVDSGTNYIENHPEESVRIYSDISGVELDIAETLFQNMSFNLSLKQALLLDLENQARWAMMYGYTEADNVPNYLDMIYPDALLSVKPENVTLISEK